MHGPAPVLALANNNLTHNAEVVKENLRIAPLLAVEGRTAMEILGSPDDLKLRSSATLFAAVSEEGSVFEQVLGKNFEGEKCARTVAMLGVGTRTP